MAPQFSAPGPALHPIMTATTVSVLDSVLVSSLIKNEPEDLTGHSHGGAVGQGRRHSEAGHSPPSLHAGHPGIPLDVAAKRLMGDAIDKTTNMVTSVISGPEGENHIVLTGEGINNYNFYFNYLPDFHFTKKSAIIAYPSFGQNARLLHVRKLKTGNYPR